MLFHSINLVEGATLNNATIAGGTSYPLTPTQGELFYRTDLVGLFVYDGATWAPTTVPFDASATRTITGGWTFTQPVTGDVTGSAGSSAILDTARDFAITGDVTAAAVSFDGAANVSLASTLATVNLAPQTDTFRKVTVNGKGLVTATSPVVSNDITTSLGYTPVNKAADTMTGTLTLAADPVNSLEAATKSYVDGQVVSASNGLSVVVVSGTAQTAVSGVLYVLTNETEQTVLTLPAAPAVGDAVGIYNFTGRTDVLVLRNGSNIMKLAEDFTFDRDSVMITLRYINATIGWSIV